MHLFQQKNTLHLNSYLASQRNRIYQYKAFCTNISSLFLRCFLSNYIVDKTSYCRQDLGSISINIKTPVYMRRYLKVDQQTHILDQICSNKHLLSTAQHDSEMPTPLNFFDRLKIQTSHCKDSPLTSKQPGHQPQGRFSYAYLYLTIAK